MPPVCVYLCRGSDCRGRDRRKLRDALPGGVAVVDVRCQSICDGPVAGFEVDGRLEWFERLDGRRVREAFAELVDGGRVRGRLAKRRVPKRSGRLR